MRLSAATFPAALTLDPALRFCASTLPDAVNLPEVARLPPVMLPVTVSVPREPTEVKLEFTTLELSVEPVNNPAAACETTPVRRLPFPTKNPPAATLPVALTVVLAKIVPCTVIPVGCTTSTFGTLALAMFMVLFETICMLDVPLAMPDIPPML